MSKLLLMAAFFAAAVVLAPDRSFAQSQPIEFGIDAAAEFIKIDFGSAGEGLDLSDFDGETAFGIPVPFIRVGFPLSQKVSIEPGFGISYSKQESADVANVFVTGTVSLLYHFGADVTRTRPYLRGVGQILHRTQRVTPAEGDLKNGTQFAAGAGLGVKVPVAEQFLLRFELNYARRFESSDLFGANVISALVGFSFLAL